MTVAKKQNFKVPTVPGVDLSDKKVLTGAKRIATRKNNDYKREVERKAPLFADVLLKEYEPMTPERVIERRIIARDSFKEWKAGFNELQRGHIRQFRAEVRELVTDNDEFRRLIRLCVRTRGGDRSSRWSRTLTLVKRRATVPLSQNADLVLAWLQVETKPVTHLDIWEKRGDGMPVQDILKALIELMEYAYVGMVEVETLPEKYHKIDGWNGKTAWSWEAVTIPR